MNKDQNKNDTMNKGQDERGMTKEQGPTTTQGPMTTQGQTKTQEKSQTQSQTQSQTKSQGQGDSTPLDYYETLNLRSTASMTDVDRAYRRLALKYHPKNFRKLPSRTENEINFAYVSEAYQALIDPERRRKYDEYLAKNPEKKQMGKNEPSNVTDKHRSSDETAVSTPFCFRSNPMSPYLEIFGIAPMNPFDHFNYFLNNGMFEDEDLQLFGLKTPHTTMSFDNDNEFFGQKELQDYMKTSGSKVVQTSKKVVKNTKVENGVRTTITETRKVEPDGHVTHFIKEEIDDGKGNKSVRYLDSLPDTRRNEIKEHVETPSKNANQLKDEGMHKGENQWKDEGMRKGENQSRDEGMRKGEKDEGMRKGEKDEGMRKGENQSKLETTEAQKVNQKK
jgi:hypothetical protein